MSVFSASHLQEHSLLQQPEGKHKHDREAMPFWHSTQEIQHILHSSSPEPPLNHHSHEDAAPYGMTHILIICVRKIIHMPLKEYHHHPTVTQHQHHQLLIKESSGGGTHVPNRQKKKNPTHAHRGQVMQETKNTTSEPYSSMVVYFACSLFLTLDSLNKTCPHTTQKASALTYWQ